MKNLSEMKTGDLAGLQFVCSCGKEHTVGIKHIEIGDGVIEKTADILADLDTNHPYLITDENIQALGGKKLQKILSDAGFYQLHSHVFAGSPALVPNETAVGAALLDMEAEDDLIIAFGSGTINDLSRIISARTGVPYIIIGTAPSMDGYASTVSPLIIGGTKITKEGVYPAAIIADISIMKDAPQPMMTAGYGDIMGKFTANTDWRLARMLTGEYYCEESAALVRTATQKCADNAECYAQRDPAAVEMVTEALILSGVAMGMVGNSRPASGAEHHLAHFWEIAALQAGKEHALHGNSVAVATVVITSLYELAADLLPTDLERPNVEEILSLLHKCGAPSHPTDIGIDKELFHYSLLHAMEIRDRYTILRFCHAKGKLEEFAQILTDRFFPC